MFSLPGILGLLFLTYVRPQAFIESLQGVPLLAAVYLLAGFGFAIDVRMRFIRLGITQLTWLIVAYFGWAVTCTLINAPSQIAIAFERSIVVMPLYLMLSQSVQSLRAFRAAAWGLVLIALFLSIIGIHQGLAPKGCVMTKSGATTVPDGRACEHVRECYADGEPGAIYFCERVGLFGTNTVEDRVRWLGVIEDPNELAMCVSLAIPLLIGLFLLRKTVTRGLLLGAVIVACAMCVIFTKSRGGQVVFLAALGVYFVRRFGVRGVIVCVLLALPVVLAGGREGGEESTEVRLEALQVGAKLLWSRPLFGVGFAQFGDYHHHTTHNSYALAGAEMGFPGMFLFIAMLYQSMKSFVVVARRYDPIGPARAAYAISGAVIAAQFGFMVGIFFLSFLESPILWVFLGLGSGFQLAISRHEPGIERAFRLRARDYAIIGGITVGMGAFFYFYTRHKLGA
jgi:hypothetical protein